MNITTLKTNDVEPYIPKIGDIFKSVSDELYILAKFGGGEEKFVCVCLNDGLCWYSPDNNIREAISGLTFVKRDVKIVVE